MTNGTGQRRGFRWTIARKIGGLATVLILFILGLLLYSVITLRGIQSELAGKIRVGVEAHAFTGAVQMVYKSKKGGRNRVSG